ncbi:MAG TPA: STM4015 family protein [Ktedonobacteraceae bacterium]|jgi:hypothetical protein
MTINEHKTHFAGKPVIDWNPGDPVPDPATTIPRISTEYEGNPILGKLEKFLADPASRAITGLVFGYEEDFPFTEIANTLIEHHEQLPHLTALFLGDITFDEWEISWIEMEDISTLFPAYPQLEHFGIRGNASSGLRLGTLHNEQLKTLIIETGSMNRSVVHDVLRSHLPALQHLELWTGSENYGGNCTVEDFAPLLSGELFPNLHYLGLRDSEFADDLAIALSQSPLLERVRILDLSLSTLGDAGATALLNCPAVRKLEKLDLHYHFCSEEMTQRLQTLPIEVDVSERQIPEDEAFFANGRFVAVSE